MTSWQRDCRIVTLHRLGLYDSEIARVVGMSPCGVGLALRRLGAMERRPRRWRVHEGPWSLLVAKSKALKNGCRVWQGHTVDGYGQVMVGGEKCMVHRLTFQLHIGALPPAPLCVSHTCENRLCINPEHLFVSTRHEGYTRAEERRDRALYDVWRRAEPLAEAQRRRAWASRA